MRAKPISFAEVIKSKSRVNERDPTPQSSLFQIMERYEDNPNEDYTLFLGPNSLQPRSKTSSFRALNSRNLCEGSQMFDSWIQRQSFVGSKENSQRNMLNSNQSQTTRSKDTKKPFIVPATKEGKQPIKSVADLVKKIESNDKENSNMPFFRAGPKHQTQRQKPQFQNISRVPPPRNIQFHDNQQEDRDIKINLIKPKQERPSARPYIQMPTVVKQRPMEREKEKERVDLDELLLKTDNIHIEIAELAQKYKQQQSNEQDEMEDSLLIQDSSKKVSVPEVIIPKIEEPKKFDAKADDAQWSRWQTAKSKINNYFQKITTQQQPKLPVKIQNTQHNRQFSSQTNNESVGYSFATNEIEPMSKQNVNLSFLQKIITIPKIQQIQSQRLPFEKIQQKSQQSEQYHYSPTFVQKDEEVYHQYHHNYDYVSPPKMQDKGSNEVYELQQKIVGSSLVFSSNVKGASPSSSKQEKSQKDSEQKSQNQRVSLSFTEQKPLCVQNANIEPSSSKKSEEYQIQTIRVHQEPTVKAQSGDSSSTKQQYNENSKQTLNIDMKTRDYNEYRIQNRSFSIDNWEDNRVTPQITIKIDSSFNMQTQINDFQPTNHRQSFKEEPLIKQSIYKEQQFKPIQPSQPVFIQAQTKSSVEQFNHTLNPNSMDNHFMKKSIRDVLQPQITIVAQKSSLKEEMKFDLNDDILKIESINTIKSSSKSSGVKGSPSNAIYGLKKVYCSPKTETVISQAQPITSAFTTLNQPKPKVETLTYKTNFEIKPAAAITKAWDMKIDTIAYSKLQPMKQSKEITSSNVQEEGEQFQFDL